MEKNPVYALDSQEYNQKLAQSLKEYPELEVPDWIDYVKSSTANERPIFETGFWYKRAASILRQIYKRGSIGVNKLKTRYGKRKRRGAKPPEFRQGAGKILRMILQQTDKAGLTEFTEGVKRTRSRAGRRLTQKGKKLMEEIK